MSRRRKLEKFQAIATMPHVYENHGYEDMQLSQDTQPVSSMVGQWNARHFKREAPLVLELACGRGEYSVGLARMYPDQHFIGIDIKGARIHQGASIAQTEGLTNVAFIRSRIEWIDRYFGQGEVDEIWITFPDPFLKDKKANRRLTSPQFIAMYRQLLKPGGRLHLKTDAQPLVDYTLEVLDEDERMDLVLHYTDIDEVETRPTTLDIMTYYERMHRSKGIQIQYLIFDLHPDHQRIG